MPPATWMIGNSPKSDINPALEAGLNAVFVPHATPGSWSGRNSAAGAGRLLMVETVRRTCSTLF